MGRCEGHAGAEPEIAHSARKGGGVACASRTARVVRSAEGRRAILVGGAGRNGRD